MINNSKQKGLITELQCELAFSRLGIPILKPICDNCRYDYVADLNGKFIRIQCKTCRLKEDKSAIFFASKSTHINSKKTINFYYTEDEIDYFYTYYDGVSYLVPINKNTRITLRLKPPLNNQDNVVYAKDYILEDILKTRENIDFKSIKITIAKKSNDKTSFCIRCGEPCVGKAKYCQKCYKEIQKENRLNVSREELKKDIRNLSLVATGKKYNVSDNTIRKICKRLNLPYRKKEIEKYSDKEWESI